MKTKILTALAIASLLISCDKSESIAMENSSEVSFSTGIATRATGDTWESDDAIGVYMYYTELFDLYDNSSNAQYTIDSGAGTSAATFTSTNPLCYPIDGNVVDFVAYYPYSTLTDGVLSINTASQTNEEEIKSIDYMVAGAASYSNSSESSPTLSFTRVMSRIVFELERLDSAKESEISNISLTNIITDGTLTIINNLSYLSVTPSESTSTISVYNNDSDIIEIIIIPQTLSSKLYLMVDGTYFLVSLSGEFTAGSQYTYNMKVGGEGVTLGGATITDWGNAAAQSAISSEKEI